MEFITRIVAAEEEEYPDIGESGNPLDEWSGIETPGLDTVKVATLHSMLTGDLLQDSLDLYQPVYVADSGTIVLRIGYALTERLATIDDDALESVAFELAATGEFENEAWSTETVLELLTSIVELAQLAESQGQMLFVWMALVQG